MNCEPGCAARHRYSGSGWSSIPVPSFFPSSIWVPARNTWHTWLFTPCDRCWPQAASRCSPVMGSTSTSTRLSAHFGQWLVGRRRGRIVHQWHVEPNLIYGQVKKSERLRKLVRVSQVMRLGTQDALTTALQQLGFSGRLNTAFIERVNLTIRHGRAALARRTWATAQQSPQLLASLEWWRA
jgi:hypothetical protein